MEVVCNMKQNTPGNLKPLVQLEFYRLNGSWYPKKKRIFYDALTVNRHS